MPRKASGNFDQKKYIRSWQKENMKDIKVRYKNEFVESFKTACKILGVSQSQIIKEAMEETIRKAGLE